MGYTVRGVMPANLWGSGRMDWSGGGNWRQGDSVGGTVK